MSLASGTRLGPYEILSVVGAGGMGEVYKGRDTRLDRTVAVKILPAALAADPKFRERFDREARAISQLTHHHICTLYDVGEHDGTAFLVMELLDGETLADRLKKGALPLDDALKAAIQIAEALSAAHRQGIVHRDLKPGNVMLTKAGAKLLDFGLAKASGPAIAGAGLSKLPTTAANLTAQGTILGTFQYMAPEQIEGREADARTDIFAFGAVFYEMLTGKKAFEGKSHASLIGAIMHADPPLVSRVQPVAPASLNRIVATCLAKEPDERWQSARDLKRAIEWSVPSDGALPSRDPAPKQRSTSRTALAWSAAAALALSTASLGYLHFREEPPVPAVSLRLQIPLPQNTPAASYLSPDGRKAAFIQGGRMGVYFLESGEVHDLAASEGQVPFWSPDSRLLGFPAEGKLKKIDVTGGPPQTVTERPSNAVWGGAHGTRTV